ncbi:hypothetical protein MTY_1097 [Moorella thermoacetica Y72]|uniref:Uncharacterized protein n=1 Tax=Moorella thermoacetica Y72 TaxID=1325331 RepID=A0A0S6UEE7_NEOTH|nr:hypothetical protein MTY_1097 [Moorella thermoacetica Y72]
MKLKTGFHLHNFVRERGHNHLHPTGDSEVISW